MTRRDGLRHNRPFVVLVVAHTITRLGFWMMFLGMLSLASFTLDATPGQTAMIIAALSLPFIVLAPFAGTFVDRSNPKWVLAGTYLTGALLTFGLVWVDALWQLIVGAVVWGITGTVILPSLGALLKRMVLDEKLRLANGIVRAGWEVSLIAGPALSGWLVSARGNPAPARCCTRQGSASSRSFPFRGPERSVLSREHGSPSSVLRFVNTLMSRAHPAPGVQGARREHIQGICDRRATPQSGMQGRPDRNRICESRHSGRASS